MDGFELEPKSSSYRARYGNRINCMPIAHSGFSQTFFKVNEMKFKKKSVILTYDTFTM
jgi:hypothetical protein